MNVFLKSQKLINLAVKNLSMQLENVNWTDYSWWVMMSYFGAKSSFRLIFFGRSLGFFKRQRNKKFKQFYDLTLSLRFFEYFFCYDIKFMFWEKFMVFYSFQEKDSQTDAPHFIKYYFFFNQRNANICIIWMTLANTINFYYIGNLE